MAGKHSDHYFRRCRANIVTTILFFWGENGKNEKCLELPNLARKLKLGEMFLALNSIKSPLIARKVCYILPIIGTLGKIEIPVTVFQLGPEKVHVLLP